LPLDAKNFCEHEFTRFHGEPESISSFYDEFGQYALGAFVFAACRVNSVGVKLHGKAIEIVT
jgi:hypothetical protein